MQCSQRDPFYIRWTLKLTPIVIHEICGDGQVINGSTEGVVTYIQPQVHPDMSLDLRHIHTARHVVTAGPQVTPHFVGVSNTSQGTDRNRWAILQRKLNLLKDPEFHIFNNFTICQYRLLLFVITDELLKFVGANSGGLWVVCLFVRVVICGCSGFQKDSSF